MGMPPDGQWFFRENRNYWWTIVTIAGHTATDWHSTRDVRLLHGLWTTFSERERTECDSYGVYRRVDKTRDPFEIVADSRG